MFGVVVVGLVVTVGLALVSVLGAVAVRIEAETAADAAALAAVTAAIDGRAPSPAAGAVAAANGAQLVRCRCPAFVGRSFSATVVVRRAIRMPLLGGHMIHIERSAEYAAGP